MGKINWGRVFLCGIVTGSVSALLQLLVFFFALPETEFAAAVEAARAGRPTVRALGLIVFFAVGILTIWLYAAIRPRYGPGPKTAVVAGFAVWRAAPWLIFTGSTYESLRLPSERSWLRWRLPCWHTSRRRS